MSAKISKEDNESEPISIDTTILKIKVKTTGDLKTKDYDLIPFHPNMADLRDLSNNSYILFPSFIKITMNDLQNAGVGSDYPSIFMNLDKYIKLIRYVTNPAKEEDHTLLTNRSQLKNYALSLLENADTVSLQKYDPLTEEEIITNNIELIKSLFFAPKSHFFILGNDYIIGESKYLPPYVPSNEKNKGLSSETKQIALNYTITVELQLLDAVNNPEAGDFMKMSCKAKKGNLAKDMKDIFGFNFGYIPVVKSSIPSILNTSEATKNRQFGKLQHEWENRNKYVKAPANERERIAMEKKWSPLQRKMAEYDREQEAYNKIPPLWIKERADLQKKYADYTTELVKLWEEMRDIKRSNVGKPLNDSFVKDQLDAVKTKMYAVVEPLLAITNKIPTLEEMQQHRAFADGLVVNTITFNEMRLIFDEYDNLKKELIEKQEANAANDILGNYEKELNAVAEKIVKLNEMNTFIKTLEAAENSSILESSLEGSLKVDTTFLGKPYAIEKKAIDDKYVKALFAGTNKSEKEADLRELKIEEEEIYEKLKTTDPYTATSIKAELAKVQANIRKKMADIKVIEARYDQTTLIKRWEKIIENIKSIKKTIESEKDKGERTILNKAVRDEMNKLFDKEIKKMKEEYLIALFKEGRDENLTKSEKEKFEKKDRPIDSADQIKDNLDSLKQQYLEIAGKLGFFNKIQGEINLLNADLARIKEMKADKEAEKKKIDTKLSEISKEMTRLGLRGNATRIATLTADSQALEKELLEKKFDSVIKGWKEKEVTYKNYIDALKKIKDDSNAQNEYKKVKVKAEYDSIDTKLLEVQGGGGSRGKKKTRKCRSRSKRSSKRSKRRTSKRRSKRSSNKSKNKSKISRHKTLRRAKKQRRRKYTR
jgi:hypothetical protein